MRQSIFYVFNLAGYNIGCFTLPFAQSFLGPFAVVATCMFDVGNSIMCTGGTYALTSGLVHTGEKYEPVNLRSIAAKLLGSVPFCCLYADVGLCGTTAAFTSACLYSYWSYRRCQYFFIDADDRNDV